MIPDFRRSFNALIEVSTRISNTVCIAQTTLVVINNALLVNDRRLLFFRFDLVSDLTSCIPGANLSIPILRPSSPSCLRAELADLWSLNGNTILTGAWFTLHACVEVGSPETFFYKIIDGRLQQLGTLKSGECLCKTITFQVEQLPHPSCRVDNDFLYLTSTWLL